MRDLPRLSLIASLLSSGATASVAQPPSQGALTTPIQHVIIIMQENRSFDNYFGTFPGANGIPKGTCVPLDPTNPGLGCVRPFHDPLDSNGGGPHSAQSAQFDLDDGITKAAMDGFVYSQGHASLSICGNPADAARCRAARASAFAHDVMGYHTADEIPNYWAYAQHFVLQDELFPGVRSWSAPSHLDLTSEWSAKCTDNTNAATCTTSTTIGKIVEYPWANLFQLLDKHGITWKYYLGNGEEPDCEDDEMTCDPQIQNQRVGSFWNPAPLFKWIQSQGPAYLAAHNPEAAQFLADAENGTLPQISWIVPSAEYSEHPPQRVTTGMEDVTSLVNAVMTSPAWSSSVIFIAWDEWGGFYDHVVPPNVDMNGTVYPIQGFGLRVPGLMISPFARAGMIDHHVLSFDSYATFFEDVFMRGARLDPAALGNPDSRPDIRDALRSVTFLDGRVRRIGNLMDELDFTQAPLPPLLLSTHIPTGIAAVCSTGGSGPCTSGTIALSWNAVAAGAVPGPFTYHVQRDGADIAQCVTGATSCTDTPASGAHLYRIYSADAQGTASPLSAAARATVP